MNIKHAYAFLVERSPTIIGSILETIYFLKRRSFCAPPKYVRKILFIKYLKNMDLIFESGTYLGRSTAIFSKIAKNVVTVEPDKALFNRADKLFSNKSNIKVKNGFSTEFITSQLTEAKSMGHNRVGFWLDGHSSDDNVALHTGIAPLINELQLIMHAKSDFKNVTILIDDMRYTTNLMQRNNGYPDIKLIYSILNENDFEYIMHFNILIARFIK
ncbi:rRNA adenine N-6-methyltransferase family protein [Planktomarina temperata]|nr:rRNA adenine N-6-methyltransferase family protein [Planktomarina temperata]